MGSLWQMPIDLNPDDVSARNVATIIRLLAEYTARLDEAITRKRIRSKRLRQMAGFLIGIMIFAMTGLLFSGVIGRVPTSVITVVSAVLTSLAGALVGFYFGGISAKEPLPPNDRDMTAEADELRMVMRAAIQLEEHAARHLDTGSRVELDVRIKAAEATLAGAGLRTG